MLITRGKSLEEIATIVYHWYKIWPETFKDKSFQSVIKELEVLISKDIVVLVQLFEGSSVISSCCINMNTNEIFNLYTLSEYRELGYATILLRETLCIALTMNVDYIYIRVPEEYVPKISSHFDCEDCGRDIDNEIILSFDTRPMSPILKTLQENA